MGFLEWAGERREIGCRSKHGNEVETRKGDDSERK
jgi:hypothetical protein